MAEQTDRDSTGLVVPCSPRKYCCHFPSSAGPSPSVKLLILMNHPFLIEKPRGSQTLMLWERTTGQAAFPTDPWRSALQHHYQHVRKHDILGSTLFWGAPKLYRAVYPAVQCWPYKWELLLFDIGADATAYPPMTSSAAWPFPCNQPDNSAQQRGTIKLQMLSFSAVFLLRAPALLCCELEPSSDSGKHINARLNSSSFSTSVLLHLKAFSET